MRDDRIADLEAELAARDQAVLRGRAAPTLADLATPLRAKVQAALTPGTLHGLNALLYDAAVGATPVEEQHAAAERRFCAIQ